MHTLQVSGPSPSRTTDGLMDLVRCEWVVESVMSLESMFDMSGLVTLLAPAARSAFER